MVLRTFSVCSVVMFTLCAAEKLYLPVPTCKRNSDGYKSCLKRAINEAWPLFLKGLPAEFEFPPLQPFFYNYSKVVIDNGVIHGEVTVSNLTIEGFKDSRFLSVIPHFSNDFFRLMFKLYTPNAFIDGIYKARGTLGPFQMGGGGYFNITMGDMEGSWDISGPVKNDTWIIEHVKIFPINKTFKMYLNNLFEGNQELSELAMIFVNENWPLLIRMMLPASSETWDTFFTDFFNRLFAKLSFSQIFPV